MQALCGRRQAAQTGLLVAALFAKTARQKHGHGQDGKYVGVSQQGFKSHGSEYGQYWVCKRHIKNALAQTARGIDFFACIAGCCLTVRPAVKSNTCTPDVLAGRSRQRRSVSVFFMSLWPLSQCSSIVRRENS